MTSKGQAMTSKGKAPTPRRAYASSRRSQQAAKTREDVFQAAIELFRTRGWAGTTVAAIAERAGVAVETVYKAGGAKSALLRGAMDVAVVGDTLPIPLVERPELQAIGEGSEDQRITRAVTLTAAIHERSAGVWMAIVEAAASDEKVDGWRLELERGRRLELARSTERIFGAPLDDHLLTMAWVLYGPENYLKLTGDEGLSRADYEAFLVRATQRLATLR
jgi:AcrR family transcriptional regulator